MFKLLVCVLIAGLVGEGQALGSSCGGRELGRSAQNQYWLSTLKHQEQIAFNNKPDSYKVFRNVKEYGAKGDGVTDDSNAINLAISEGDRCGPGCASSTVSPAIIYFPPGKYLVSRPLLQFYYTQFIGDAHDLPTLIMAPTFDGGLGLVDADDYINSPDEIWTNQNNFYRQVRNFIIDLTRAPATKSATAIHWQVAQGTSITNVHIKMSKEAGNKHQGVWMENGSGGFMSDVTFDGGKYGLWVGSQQFTSRNLTITNADTAIYVAWTWGWTFKGIKIENCKTGLDITAQNVTSGELVVGSVLLMDSQISNTEVAVKTITTANTKPVAGGSLILDNVHLNNVQKAVAQPKGQEVLGGGNKVIKSWGQGHFYERNGNHNFRQADLPAPDKSNALLDGQGNFFEKSKPTYTDVALGDFVSVKDEGVKGDGRTDDTNAIKQVIEKYAGCKVIYFPSGYYVVTDTIYIPPGSRIIGEIWSTILAKGNNFADQNNPRPVFQVGKANEQGVAEISEMILSTSGPVVGAIMVQINMKERNKGDVGLWDVHFRIGGAKGTELQTGNCPKGGAEKPQCAGSHTMLHIGQTGSAYLENVWAWVADHDLDGPSQISIYNGRGILVESKEGPVWMYGTASEHSVMHQYNLANTKNVIMATIQTETPYYQAYPPAPKPFHTDAKFHDPDYSHCAANSVTCGMAYGLIVQNSENIYVYGAGLYNFFQNYDQGCLKSEYCQDTMVQLKTSNKNVYFYGLNTKAADTMVNIDGTPKVKQSDNRSTYCSTIAALLP